MRRIGRESAVEDAFVAFVLEQLSGVDALGCRWMFGGHGLYRGATLFGIVSGGRLYFKTDDATAGLYAVRGMSTFRPAARGPLRTYYEVPADVLRDRARLTEWAQAAARCAAAPCHAPA